MNNIIQHFEEKIIRELGEILDNIDGETDISDVINRLEDIFNDFGRNIIKYILEESDRLIRESKERKRKWVIQERKMDKTLITEFGPVKYERTYFESKGDKGYTYLVDDYFGIAKYQRVHDGLSSKLVENAKEYSYKKSADIATEADITRETVKNKIRELGKIDNLELNDPEEKKSIKRLYVEADEDHISLQNGKNSVAKLVYVHEGIEKQGNRKHLKNAQYFSGIYSNAEDLWLEVLDYINANYKKDDIENIYLAGDGGSWIIKGLRWLPRSKYVLDRYHLNQYVLKATAHMPKKRPKIWKALNKSNQTKVNKIFKEIIDKTEDENKIETVKEVHKYILNNWGGIKVYNEDSHALGCSAEGHVSHVLASRMSSRPIGWSEKGAEQMARLRAFKYNGGKQKDIKKLLERQKENERIKNQRKRILSHQDKRRLFPEPKESIPALRRGKVNGLFRVLQSVAF